MDDNVIDTLSLEIESNAHGADKSINKLAKSLIKLQTSVSDLGSIDLTKFSQNMKGLIDSTTGFDVDSIQVGISSLRKLSQIKTGNLSNAAIGIKDMSEALKGMSDVTIPNLEGVPNLVSAMKEISSIGKIDLKSDTITSSAIGIMNMAEALKSMSGVTIPSLDGIGLLSENLRKFGGVNVTQATENLPNLSRDLVSFVSGLNGVGSLTFDFTGVSNLVQNISRLGGAKATEATSNLPQLKDQILQFVTGLNKLQAVTFDVSGLTSLVSAITKLGGSAAGKAVPNIENLAVALKNMMTTLSKAPKVSQNLIQMTTAMAQLASNGNRIQGVSTGIASGFGRIGPAAASAKKHTLSLAAAFGKFYATYWLVLRGLGQFKKAIDISSNLTEVQNVVDVTFGDMKQKVEDLAATSIQDFGMSELTAKQISSRFQAMGIAMGFTQDKMSDMSIELTKLAADMASFYNVEQDAVAKSLQSVFTGETEPLRKYGLDLTNATLQAWALAQGLDVNVQKMSQMEKTALRYRYVMENSAAAIGDFSRTSGSWANQLRILNQQFQQLGGIVGGVLINAFKPFISALNSVMQSVIKFAQTVANALGAIFGWTIEINSGGLATDFEAAGAGAEEMDKGTGGAAKNLKDMNKYIAAWHEVNNMTTSDDTGGGGGGGGVGGAAGDLGDAADAQFKRTESILDKFKSEIDNLYDLGAYIGKVLTDAMNGIDWEKVYQGARDFGTGLAQFLNGLISPQLFGAVGRTIAGALNTALYFLNSFGHEFDWTNFGNSIAEGINRFFDNFQFSLLADTLNTWAKGMLDALIVALQKIEWREIGVKIGEFLVDIDFLEIGQKIVQAIWEAINGAFKLYKGMLETAPLETAILTLVGAVELLHSKAFAKLLTAIAKADSALSLLSGGFKTLKTNISDKGLFGGISTSLTDLGNKLTTVQKYAVTAVAALGEFVVVKNSIYDLASGTGSVLANLLELGAAAGIASVAMYAALGPAGLAVAAITGIIAGILAIRDAWADKLESEFESFQETMGSNVDTLNDATDALNGLSEVQKGYLDNADSDVEKLGRLADSYFELADQTDLTREEQERLKEYADELIDQCPLLAGAIDDVTGKYTTQKDEIYKLIQAQQEQMQADAYKKVMDEYADALTKANVELAVSENQYEANEEKISKLSDAMDSLVESGKDQNIWASENADILKDLGVIYEDGNFSAKDLAETISFFEKEQIELNDAIRDGNAAVSYAETAYNTANEKMEEHQQKQKELIRGSAEYQQALRDLQYDMSNMNLSLSEDFLGNLAESGFDSSGLKQYFESISEGVSANSESLKRMFANIGMSLPDELATQLEGREAEPQAAAIRLIMGIQSGVQATEPQLIELFSNLGIELVPELIKSIEGQDAAIQAATINTLSKIEQGESLAEKNLRILFSNLGMSVPNELIQSMDKMEGPTQKSVIELLSQITAGHDFSKEELTTKFNELGLELPQSFQDAMESMNDKTFQQAMDLFGQVISATDEERGPLLEKLRELGIDLSEDAFVPGIEDGIDDVEEASKELAKTPENTISSMMDSVFNKAKELGKYVAQGYAKGISENAGLAETAAREMADKSYLAPKKKLKVKSPSRLFSELGQFVVLGFNKGIIDESDSTYNMMSDFAQRLSNGFDVQAPKLDLSVPNVDFSPKSHDIGKFQSTMQMEMDARMASLEFENRQLRETLEAILVEVRNKQLIVGDRDIFNANRRETVKFGNRTKKDPYPIYGKS